MKKISFKGNIYGHFDATPHAKSRGLKLTRVRVRIRTCTLGCTLMSITKLQTKQQNTNLAVAIAEVREYKKRN